MSLLKEFEKKLEETLEGFFAKKFRKSLQPVELAKKLARQMEEGRTISISKIYAPNKYLVFVSRKDKENLSSFEKALKKELQDFLKKAAAKRSLTLPSEPQIEILLKAELALGEVEIESKLEVDELPEDIQGTKVIPLEKLKAPSARARRGQRATLSLLNGEKKKFPLEKEIITLGRLESNDICLSDSSVSRLHAEIRWENNRFFLIDLGSTNGTYVDQKRVKKAVLKDKKVLTLGKIRLQFGEEEGV